MDTTAERFGIDPFSAEPGHLQLALKIFGAWFSGCLAPERLPSLQEFAEGLNMPAGAVNWAFEVLREAGMIAFDEQQQTRTK